jgi:hypothetical protein
MKNVLGIYTQARSSSHFTAADQMPPSTPAGPNVVPPQSETDARARLKGAKAVLSPPDERSGTSARWSHLLTRPQSEKEFANE